MKEVSFIITYPSFSFGTVTVLTLFISLRLLLPNSPAPLLPRGLLAPLPLSSLYSQIFSRFLLVDLLFEYLGLDLRFSRWGQKSKVEIWYFRHLYNVR
jgi:hypothetical protein